MNRTLLLRSLLHSLGVVVYVLAVATIMQHANQIFGPMNTTLAAVGFLLLFSVSAAVVGSLIFVYPVSLFLNGRKREAITAVSLTIGWMVVETAAVLVTVFAMK